jgi:hypothetical protein
MSTAVPSCVGQKGGWLLTLVLGEYGDIGQFIDGTRMTTCNTQRKRNSRRKSHRRTGYALLICLFVALVCSVSVLSILNTARFETLEISAKQRATASQWAAKAGVERAVALLLDDPDLRGTVPSIQVPAGSNTNVTASISQNGQNLTISATANDGTYSRTEQMTMTISQLQTRIANLPN